MKGNYSICWMFIDSHGQNFRNINRSDCSCPPEVDKSDTTSDKDEEEQANYLWIILIALLLVIIIFRIRPKNEDE